VDYQGDVTGAEQVALEYSRHPDADAFEIGSTLRQLVDVWRLTEDSPPATPYCRCHARPNSVVKVVR
jgi:hypothetical protein